MRTIANGTPDTIGSTPLAWSLAASLASVALLPACGAGTAGIVAGAGGSGGSSTPALNAFVVETPKVSPTPLRLEATKAVQAALFYDTGAGEQPMTQLGGAGVAGNEVSLPAGVTELDWNFAAELQSAGFQPDVHLTAKIAGGAPLSGGELTLGLGNDPPVVVSVDPTPTNPADPSESSGNVEVRLVVSDNSSDVVAIHVRWRRASDPPEAWQSATAAGVFPGGVQTTPKGVTLSFFWNTNVDLFQREDDVLLQVTADDGTLDKDLSPIGISLPVVSTLIHIDNNEPPIVQLDSGPLITNPDERRGIPIPFTVIDKESDLVDVIFQWRRPDEEFPELPNENAALDGILVDPVLRREKHICTPYPHFAHGRVIPVDATSVRLPELAANESWILASGIVGRHLELMRPSNIPEPITATWGPNPLDFPVAALPIGDGLTALILDAPGGSGRLREIELATGRIVRDIATLGAGLPGAMAYEPSDKAVLVASDLSGLWRIERVELATGIVTELHAAGPTNDPGPIRGLAVLGANVVLATIGSSLVMLDHTDPRAPREETLITNLATPWGIVVDPLDTNQIYLAEREAVTSTGTGRVLAIKLESHEKVAVIVNALPILGLEEPSAIALAGGGARLLAVASAPGRGRRLVGLSLGGRDGNIPFALGRPILGEAAEVASGPDDLLLLALPLSNELLISGGLEQRIGIHAFEPQIQSGEPRRQLVTLETPMKPSARSGQPWRIADGPERNATAEGVDSTFVWDSQEAVGGPVLFRALPRDDEQGTPATGAAPKTVRASLDVEPLLLGSAAITNLPSSVVAADLDGDGDPDLVSANGIGDDLTIFFQFTPRSFGTAPLVLGGTPTTNGPRSVAASDLDGDGDQDLVSANGSSDNLTLFFQNSPGGFSPVPIVLGDSSITDSPESVAAADLDGDGDQDLVTASSDNLTVFFQSSPGSFDPSALRLGSSAITSLPLSVRTADLDGDGDLDIVSANLISNNLTLFFQNSLGTFSATPLVLGGSGTTDSPESVAVADLDGDGDQDLVSANGSGDNLTVFFQSSLRGFDSSPLRLGGPATTHGPVYVTAADFDGDGDQDLVSVNSGDHNLTFFFQAARGTLNPNPIELGSLQTQDGPSSVAAADLDGDGDEDLVSANLRRNNLTVFFHLTPGTFGSTPLTLGGFPTTNGPNSCAVADLDGDGDLDLVSANYEGDNLTVFFQISPGSFGGTPLAIGSLNPFSVAAADFDGDSDLDLVSANRDGSKLTIFFQRTPGDFGGTPLVFGNSSISFGPNSVAAADLDGDGDQDIVSANVFGHNLTIFFQFAPGSFGGTPLTLGSGSSTLEPYSVAAADLDGDGDKDIVSANAFGNNLPVFFQLTPGVFESNPLVLGGFLMTNRPVAVAAADIDGDGDQDLVSANQNGNNLTVFFQELPGIFAPNPLTIGGLPTTDGPHSLFVADIDGDGDEDLISANFNTSTGNGDKLTIFLQSSPGRFDPSPLVLGSSSVTDNPSFVAAADLDGDGDQDLVSTNSKGSSLTVFWGGR